MAKRPFSYRCAFGVHLWDQSRELGPIDVFPPPFVKYDNPTRKCFMCGKRQRWLPGYGGSEWGCWLSVQPELNSEEK